MYSTNVSWINKYVIQILTFISDLTLTFSSYKIWPIYLTLSYERNQNEILTGSQSLKESMTSFKFSGNMGSIKQTLIYFFNIMMKRTLIIILLIYCRMSLIISDLQINYLLNGISFLLQHVHVFFARMQQALRWNNQRLWGIFFFIFWDFWVEQNLVEHVSVSAAYRLAIFSFSTSNGKDL